ncbi:MAG TPA: pitrilysin family protein [Candidatus Acidoferrales bacterium]|nr:pitrilysin family protein [Candidatus Acidoferrales bacterium]
MDHTYTRLIFTLLAILFVSMPAAAQGTGAQSQEENAAPKEQKGGTGIVPPGVKLAPEMPGAAAPKPFHFPNAESKTLSNGLRVFVVSDASEPAIAAQMVILSAGSIKDPASMPGVAEMTANMLTQGTEKRSARDIAEAIDFVGGSLSASAGRDATTVSLDVVKKDLETGMDLMSDVVLHPSFKTEELERQRQQLLSTLQVQYADPEYLASVVFSRVLYGESPYGWPSDGTPETVRNFTPEDLAKFHDANYAPNQTLLAFAGDITPEEAFAVAEKYFEAWPKLAVETAEPPAPPKISGLRIWLIDKPDAVQTQIRAGKLGIRRNDPNYIPVEVMNRIFGGGYNSRLNTEVRIKKGLTYGASSSFEPHRYAGSFTVDTFTRTEETVEATKLVVDLIAKMSTGDVTPAEMDFARNYLAGVYPIQSETAEQVAGRVLTAAAFGLPSDFNSTYPERILAVTSAQVKEMAQQYLSPDDLDIVLAGNVAKFRDALKKQFPDAKYDEIPFEQIDVLAKDLRKAKETSEEATPESLEHGKEILMAAANAAGGDTLASVSTLEMTEKGSLHGPNGDTPLKVTWQVAYPYNSHGDVTMGESKAVQVCDGKSAWVQFQGQTHEVTPAIGEFERGIALFGGGWGLYQQVLAGKIEGQFLGEEEIEGKKTLGVGVKAEFGSVKLYFDAESHLLAEARYQSKAGPNMIDVEQHWSDYRPVEGRQFAFTTDTFRNGAKVSESTIENVTINPKIDASAFANPGAAPQK